MCIFFFQAEDGIRDLTVTGVQTCALPIWPYSHGCGLRLIFYLVGVATVVATGLWASVASWRRRMGLAHVVSQILIVWGVLLMTREVLPRVGSNAAALWLCPDVPPPPSR